VSEAQNILHPKRPYSKPGCTPVSISEVATLLRAQLPTPEGVSKAGETIGPLPNPILLVEGYASDMDILRKSLENSGFCSYPNALVDDEELLEIGFAEDQHPSSGRPSILLLDFRLPSQGEQRRLEKIGKTVKLRRLPVAILINSAEEFQHRTEHALKGCWRLNVPLNSTNLAKALRAFVDLWRISDELLLLEKTNF
jgi:CheY-like chemotaxis protein